MGQVCDAPEFCTGSGTTCPPDVLAPNTTVCRPSAGACDLAETCTGSSINCPADSKSTGVCRPSAGECDVAESCNGISNTCPPNVTVPDGTSCTDDGLFCDGTESCQGGLCASSGSPCSLACDETNDACLSSLCATAPLTGCRTAEKSLLLLKNNSTNDDKDRLVWKWIKGMATSQTEFADPQNTATYSLCIYNNGTALVGTMDVPPDGTKWQQISTKGYKYTDVQHTQGGAFKIKLKGSDSSKSKALVKARGAELMDPIDSAALTLPVKVQLVNNDNGLCFEANYTAAKNNSTSKFKAKAP